MSWWSRVRNTLSSRRLEDEIDEELRDHLERRAAEFRGEGLTGPDADRRARQVFGNVTLVRERSRDVRLWTALDSAQGDVRYAWRGLRRSPVFAGTAIVSLGLAIGSITAIYAIVDAAFLRPPPVPEPERLFTLGRPAPEQPAWGASGADDLFNYPLFLQLKAAASGSARLSLFRPADRAEGQVDDPGTSAERLAIQYVSGDAFDTLGVRPAAGRLLSAADDHPAGFAPVVLSHDGWRRLFRLDPAAIGRRVFLDGRPHVVVGITAQGFSGVEPGTFVDVWLPAGAFDPGAFTNRDSDWFRITGRLIGTATSGQLQARLQPVFHQDQADRVQRHSALTSEVRRELLAMPLVVEEGVGRSAFRRLFARPIGIVFSVAAGLLLIACANVASLLLARSSARAPEMSLRVSLGAGRARLVRQLLTENLILSVLAGVFGGLLARLGAPLLLGALSSGPDQIQLSLDVNARVLVFCLGVCVCSMLLFGLLPAWQGSIARPLHLLRGLSSRAGRFRTGRAFVGVQCAFAFTLVLVGTAFTSSLWHLRARDPGFNPRGVVMLTFGVGGRPSGLLQAQQLEAGLLALPQVQSAAFAWLPLLDGQGRREHVLVPGKPLSSREETFARISPGFFSTLQIPLLAGRDFDTRDDEGGPTVPTIVNQAFARRYFGTEAVMDRQFGRADGTVHRIVGVAGNAAYADLRSGPEPIAYFPMKPPRQFVMYVRTTLDSATLFQLAVRETQGLGPGAHVVGVTTLEGMMNRSLQRETLLADVGGAFGAIGLLLAAIGVFGLLNYTVTRRTNEIGIRAALGATPRQLVRLVLREATGAVASGLAVGFLGSMILLRIARAALYGVGFADPIVMASATGIFLAAALIAAALPIRRATATDPLLALRRE